MESATTLLWVSSLFGGSVSLALEIGMLIIALGPVSKHRPDASLFFVGAAGLNLFVRLLRFVATPLLIHFVGVPGYVTANAAISMLATFLYGASGVSILLGILRLAIPANRDPTRYQ